nr:MAG TPA: hypothetical protein [Caudoviricetes sp.]
MPEMRFRKYLCANLRKIIKVNHANIWLLQWLS